MYKNQPYLEKRFSNLKSVTDVAPMFLKSTKRIEAMLFLYFIALMIISLMERNIRKNMEEKNEPWLRIGPGQMKIKRPTWNRLKFFFRNITLLTVTVQDQTLSKVTELTSLHYKVSNFLGVPSYIWENLTTSFWRYNSS